MAVSGTISVAIDALETSTTNTIGPAKDNVNTSVSIAWTDGSGASQANKQWSKTATLTATSATFDLTSLTGTFGTVTFTKIKGLILINTSTTDGAMLTVGNAASNVWAAPFGGSTQTVKVGPGSCLVLSAMTAQSTGAWTVDASNKNLKIDAGSATITYKLVLIGV